MTEKELRKLGRHDLLELLVEQSRMRRYRRRKRSSGRRWRETNA